MASGACRCIRCGFGGLLHKSVGDMDQKAYIRGNRVFGLLPQSFMIAFMSMP